MSEIGKNLKKENKVVPFSSVEHITEEMPEDYGTTKKLVYALLPKEEECCRLASD